MTASGCTQAYPIDVPCLRARAGRGGPPGQGCHSTASRASGPSSTPAGGCGMASSPCRWQSQHVPRSRAAQEITSLVYAAVIIWDANEMYKMLSGTVAAV